MLLAGKSLTNLFCVRSIFAYTYLIYCIEQITNYIPKNLQKRHLLLLKKRLGNQLRDKGSLNNIALYNVHIVSCMYVQLT